MNILQKLEKHKWVEWLIGAAVLIVAYLALKARSSAQAQGAMQPVIYQQPSSGVGVSPGLAEGFQAVLSSIANTQQGLAAVSQNQVTSASIEEQVLGASSWLTCCDAAFNCDASCFKQKGGSTVQVPGSGSVTNVKTQKKDIIAQYAEPFAGCRQGAGWNLACVGSLMAGSPTFNTITAETTGSTTRTGGTRTVRVKP